MSQGPETDARKVAQELDLVDEDYEELEPDRSAEATAEADMSETGPEEIPVDVEVTDVGEEPGTDEDATAEAAGAAPQLTRVAQKLRRQGIVVKATAGWQARARPGSFDPRGVMFHHTASKRTSGAAPSLGTVVNGRPDLAGPLCELLVARDGTVFLVAGGRANHAGKGGPWRNVPKHSGNAFIFGVEVENDGKGEPWSQDLLRTCETVFAVLLVDMRRAPVWVVAHKEWAPGRKKDPAGVDMDRFRRRVAEAMRQLA
jgi:hypothetical protein